jgi:hypothetical protein
MLNDATHEAAAKRLLGAELYAEVTRVNAVRPKLLRASWYAWTSTAAQNNRHSQSTCKRCSRRFDLRCDRLIECPNRASRVDWQRGR